MDYPETILQVSPQTSPPTQPVRIASDLHVGGDEVVLMAGPCSVESYDQARAVAEQLHRNGVRIVRGGAFKPRTSPDTFRGLGEEGLKILRAVADEFNLLVVTEALGVDTLPLVCEYGDIIQIGSRNMQHFPLLWAAGETQKPILLKRGFMSTVEEWLLAARHIEQRGNENVMLCERGIRGFDPTTRNVLDVGAVAFVKQTTPYPIIADPSHAMGKTDLVLPAARAAVAAGADGLLVEFHPDPANAWSDGDQSLALETLPGFIDEVGRVAGAVGRSFG